jgi:peptidoglycan/LPS O-acetylase OafA/YrhL
MTVPVRQAISARVDLLDYLRGFAAVAVWAFHWLFNGINNGKLSSLSFSPAAPYMAYGYLGVHLFFLISGFVILQSTHQKSPAQFAVARLVRLYPAFWVALSLTSAVAAFWGEPLMSVTARQFIANLSMVPALFREQPVDGVYWTLVYELKFYALVFVCLLLGLGERLPNLVPGWALLMLGVALLCPAWMNLPFLGGYYSLFVGGAAINTGVRRGWTLYRSTGVIAAWVASSVYCADAVPALREERNYAYSVPVTVSLVSLGYLSMLVSSGSSLSRWRLAGATTIGALTYPVYLLHAHLGYMTLSHTATDETKWVGYATCGCAVLVLAYAMHVLVERKGSAFWRRVFVWIVDPTVRRLASALERLTPREQ